MMKKAENVITLYLDKRAALSFMAADCDVNVISWNAQKKEEITNDRSQIQKINYLNEVSKS
jgi:hypothetical protein